MGELIKSIFDAALKLSGFSAFLSLFKGDDKAFAILLIASVFLTVLWIVRLTPKKFLGSVIGRYVGGLSIGLIALGIVAGIGQAILSMMLSFTAGLIGSAIGTIPIVGKFLQKAVQWIASWGLMILATILIVKYMIKNGGSIFERIGNIIKKPVENWQAEGGEGIGGAKPYYVYLASLIIAGVICHPKLNASMHYIPAIASAILGVFSLFTTNKGKALVDSGLSKAKDRPRQDGSWNCECGTRNPKEAKICLGDNCRLPNPFWVTCTCGKELLRKKRGSEVTCTCGKIHPALPEYHQESDRAPSDALPEVPNNSSPSSSCTHCEEEKGKGHKHCEFCGHKFINHADELAPSSVVGGGQSPTTTTINGGDTIVSDDDPFFGPSE